VRLIEEFAADIAGIVSTEPLLSGLGVLDVGLGPGG